MHRMTDNGTPILESATETEKFFSEPGRNHYVVMMIRPGAQDCLKSLEQAHYTPGTPQNELFHLRALEWSDLIWIIASIPEADHTFMEKAATATGLRISSGIPVVVSTNIERFPLSGKNVYSLENIPGHPVYGH
jgi:hypothetical protein